VIATTQRRQLVSNTNPHEILDAKQTEVRDALVERGVAEDKATAICRVHDLATVRDQIEYIDDEIARDGGKRIKNPAGFMIAFIEGGKKIPTTFETTSKREERRLLMADQITSRERQTTKELEELNLRQRYESWRRKQADSSISDFYTASELDKKLKLLRVEVSKDRRIAIALDRLSAEQRRVDLLRLLQKEVAAELPLATYEEWLEENGQGVLFALET
jgi:hypothetical protein